ncbi:DNA mismatch repair protein MutS [Enterococcus saccharolyticus]|uniref:MutS-related protein n=1 Tax=Enterococcus saccharolyticus TaxID=41997 RepID=UPI001E58E750|nr:DNA mismatch repair protein MutS [Enterococcus saccharolyticus]MCD5002589.1 DNA mismatch repair protein MutS [Enterococcus saccharolyticus]
MSEQLFVVCVVLAIVIFITSIEIYQRIKLKRIVQEKWGKPPYQPRFDKEESLKMAWQDEQSFATWDSEIDDITWYDLDMFTIFEQINATYSSVGSEALYQQLRHYHWQPDLQLEELIQFYQAHPAKREKIQYHFAQLGKQDRNFSKHYLAKKEKQTLGSLPFFLCLGALPFVGIFLLLFGQSLGLALLLGSIVFNMIYYHIQKARLETELNSMRYLVQTIAIGNKIAKIDHPLQKDMQHALTAIKNIPRFGFSFRTKSNSEAELLFDYFNMMVMLPFISYGFVLDRIVRHNQEAIHLWELLGKLEVAAAILNFRSFMPYTCQPVIQDGPVQAQDCYHPLLTDAVANPVDWSKNTLVTGSNASGKSTYVKSIAINCLLAQTIQTALATSFTLQAGHVLTSMAIEDDLSEGDSYFVAEIKSVKRLLDKVQTQEHCYCFIDEILKGTNTIERIAASSSIVDWLTTFPSLAIVATHDIELTEMLKETCENIHFSEQVTEENGVSFDYLVKPGPATTRNAIELLSVLHYPQEIITKAKNEAAYFDQHRQWL